MWIFPRKVGSSPRQRGLPRHGHVCLGESEDSGDGLSGSPRRACDCSRLVFIACLRLISWSGF